MKFVRDLFVLSYCLVLVAVFAAAGFADEPCNSRTAIEQVKTSRPKVGLALGGGGTRGSAHVGVLKVLQSEGIPVDYIAGTSMGAIVGGLYCAGVAPEVIEKKLLDLSLMRSFITGPISVHFATVPIKVAISYALRRKSYIGLYDGRKFLKYLNNSIPECKREISSLPIPFRAVALNLTDGQVHEIVDGNLGLAMLASSAVPTFRQPVPIADKLFVDGGVMKNLPVNVVKKMGADVVIAVDVDERINLIPAEKFKVFGAVPRRVINLQLNQGDSEAEQAADIIIHPNVDGIGLISRRREDGARAIKAGEESARAALPAIRLALQGHRFADATQTETENAANKTLTP